MFVGNFLISLKKAHIRRFDSPIFNGLPGNVVSLGFLMMIPIKGLL